MNKDDVLDRIYQGIAWLTSFMHGLLGLTQSGNLRWYAMAIATGAVIFMGMTAPVAIAMALPPQVPGLCKAKEAMHEAQ